MMPSARRAAFARHIAFPVLIVLILLLPAIAQAAQSRSEASLSVTIGPKLAEGLIKVKLDSNADIGLNVSVNEVVVGFISAEYREVLGGIAVRPGKNYIRFLPAVRERPSNSDSPIKYLFFSPVGSSLSLLGKLIQAVGVLPDESINDIIFDFNVTAGDELESAVGLSGDRKHYVFDLHRGVASGAASLVGVHLGPSLVERVIASEVIETPAGVEQEYEISRVFESSVAFTQTVGAELAGNLDLGAFGAEIKAKIEAQESRVIKQSETIRRNLKIDGSKTPVLRVDWIGVFRAGDAEIFFRGKKKTIPFSIQIGLKPKISLVNG